MTERVAAIVRELRAGLEATYGERLERLVLFGSQARGDAGPDSDVDVLVVLRGAVDPVREIRRTGEMVAGIALRHDVDVAPAFLSTERWERERSSFVLNVRDEGVAV